uniref:Ras-related protein Rab-1 n=1 Tax=Timema californicum TaxID=61474 RepID=A0A7R9IYT4_TIMCA|nr:unnamed protein product [Timema californicum]
MLGRICTCNKGCFANEVSSQEKKDLFAKFRSMDYNAQTPFLANNVLEPKRQRVVEEVSRRCVVNDCTNEAPSRLAATWYYPRVTGVPGKYARAALRLQSIVEAHVCDLATIFKMALDFAATYKVLVLGDSNVGKTCIVHRYCDERYYDTYISTIGIDFKQKIINLDGTPIKLQIWDTAGQERFRTLTTAYYRGAMGILLMYDVTSLDSFNHLSYWLRNIQENASPDVVKVLAGNKCDAAYQRAVEAERGEKIAESFDMPFFEVSCKQNINIEEAFLTLARRIREQRNRRASLFDSAERAGADQVDLTKEVDQPGEGWRCAC